MADDINTPDRNHTKTAQPAHDYGAPGWGDGTTTAATPEGAIELVKNVRKSKVGFSGSAVRHRLGGPIGAILDFLFGKDPDIFDSEGRVRHKFTDAKWKEWDDRIRASKEYDWRAHSGRETAQEAPKK